MCKRIERMPYKKLKTINIDRVCRACLTENGEMKSLSKHVIDMFVACASINVKQNDGLPSRICTRCFRQLTRFYVFKKRVEKCEVKLQELLVRNAASKKKKRRSSDHGESNSSKTDELDETWSQTDTNTHRTRSAAKRGIILKDETVTELLEIPNEISLDAHTLYMNEPPPLVPLVPITPEEIPIFPVDKAKPPVELALRPISDDTPPLVPIKLPTGLDALSTALANSDIIVPKFNCPNCTEEFAEPLALKEHVASLHREITALTCNICKKQFADRNRLIGHLKGHTVQKLYACKICSKRYPNPSTFKVHMRTHTGERPFKCQICNKGFVRWAGVIGHMRTHNASKPFQCDICERGFKLQSNLERHKILHTGDMPFCCSYCGKTFTQNDNLQLHVRTYHTNERPYLCNECGKSFVCSTRLKRHMWVHTGFKRYMCQHCPKSYSNSNDLKKHGIRTHNGEENEADKPYACVSCDMRFFYPCRLAKHMKTHDRPFACSECSKTFPKEDMLNKHILKKHQQIYMYHNAENETLEDTNLVYATV